MNSTQGPKISMADVNNDGQKDLFIGGSKGTPASLFFGNNGSFKDSKTENFVKNKNSEDTASLLFDADNDGDLDLYVCSGGVEFSQYSSDFLDRLYFNDGKGNFILSDQKLPAKKSLHSTSTVLASDIDNDGDLDLFVGERIKTLKYGIPCSGFVLENDGQGNFSDVTKQKANDLIGIGMITDAEFQDLDMDGDEDLVVVGEFMGVEILVNDSGSFSKKKENVLINLKGWWNTIYKSDLDGDGDMDFILGNHGLNSRFKASKDYPITLFSKDFDDSGFIDPILTFRSENGKDYPYELMHNLINQIKELKKKFPNYESFKNAGIKDIFTKDQLVDATILKVNTLSSLILINIGDFNFEVKLLPTIAQFSPIYAIAADDFDHDGDQDIILGGNLYSVKPEIGRYDALNGVYLENDGKLNFKSPKNGNGFFVKGEIRDFILNMNRILVARNSDSLAIFKY
jgi:hypothetical protein